VPYSSSGPCCRHEYTTPTIAKLEPAAHAEGREPFGRDGDRDCAHAPIRWEFAAEFANATLRRYASWPQQKRPGLIREVAPAGERFGAEFDVTLKASFDVAAGRRCPLAYREAQREMRSWQTMCTESKHAPSLGESQDLLVCCATQIGEAQEKPLVAVSHGAPG
jgi:hypothetical protein